MKINKAHWKTLIVICIFSLFAVTHASAEDNGGLALNPSFEMDSDQDGIPDGWRSSSNNNILTNPGFEEEMTDWSRDKKDGNGMIDTTVARTGEASARITGGVSWTSLKHRDIPVEPGATYLISAYIKTENVTKSKVFIHFGTKDNDGNWVVKDNDAGISNLLVADNGTHDWQKIEGQYTVSPNAAYISYLRVRINSVIDAADEIAWFDDLSIRKVGGIDSSQAYSGASSLKVVGADHEMTETWLSDEFPVVGGEAYNIQSYVKGDQLTNNPFLSVQFANSEGVPTDVTVTSDVYGGFEDWKVLSGKLIAPKDATTARLGLNLEGSGIAWFDDVAMAVDTTPVPAKIMIAGTDTMEVGDESLTASFSATVLDQYGQEMDGQAVRWFIDSAYSGVRIDSASGVLTVDNFALSHTVRVNAESVSRAGIIGMKSIEIVPEFKLNAMKNGANWIVTVEGDHIGDLYAYEIKFRYDPTSVDLQKVESLLPGFSSRAVTVGESVYFAGSLLGNAEAVQSKVPMAKLTFKARKDAKLQLEAVKVVDRHLTTRSYVSNEEIELPSIEIPIPSEGSSGPQESEQQGRAEITADQIKASDTGEIVISSEDGLKHIVLPVHTAELLQGSALTLRTANMDIRIPATVFKALNELVPRERLEGSKISFKAEKADRSGIKGLLAAVNINSGAEVTAMGDALHFSIAITDTHGKSVELNEFKDPITVSFKVAQRVDRRLTGIYFISENGELEYVGGKWNNDMITAEISHFSAYAVLQYDKTFSDVPSTHWAKDDIKELAAKQLISGVTSTAFEPDRNVTRAEFAALLIRALGIHGNANSSFTDVTENAWYANAVGLAEREGIVAGVGEREFAPAASITRQEMAVMVVRAYEYETKTKASAKGELRYSDRDEVSEWAKTAIIAAREMGLMIGRSASQFQPLGNGTRAETAKLLINLLEE